MNRKHGEAAGGRVSSEYSAWVEMKQRCFHSGHHAYANYGGRGITVCERWMKFENFLADMGRKPSSALSIDRINNDGNYEPGNCRWATRKEQNWNRRPVTNKTGFTGVRHNRGGKFQAIIRAGGRYRHLGMFETAEGAAAAYNAARNQEA